jgi:type IV pilus assembly protein PilA
MRKQQNVSPTSETGFSLIELLVVVAIILIIAAISITNYSRSRIAANETSAVATLKVINTAQIAYSAAYPTVGFASSLGELGPVGPSGQATSTAAGLLDNVLGCANQPCQKTGYQFTITNASLGSFTGYATPISLSTGNRGFCSNQLSTMTFDPNGGINCTQPVQ